MRKLTFKKFLEATDIFGFDHKRSGDDQDEKMSENPINSFNLESMMDILKTKTIGNKKARVKFVNEISWGDEPGSVKLDIDPGSTFYIKRLNKDKKGNNVWVSKKMFQLNRHGYGGLEDIVAEEIYNELEKVYEGSIDSPVSEYSDLENLTHKIYNKATKVMKNIFIPEGIKKLNDNAYIIKMGVRGHGLETYGHNRVEQNQTLVSYDPECGTIRINNYNIESPVGKAHSWKLNPLDLDLYCFPTQSRDEISELVAIHYKYY